MSWTAKQSPTRSARARPPGPPDRGPPPREMAAHNIGFTATFQPMSTPPPPGSEPEHPEQRREGPPPPETQPPPQGYPARDYPPVGYPSGSYPPPSGLAGGTA